MSEKGVIEAEKGRNLSPQNLHIRLRVVEIVVLISLLLNVVQGFIGVQKERELKSQINDVKNETGVR